MVYKSQFCNLILRYITIRLDTFMSSVGSILFFGCHFGFLSQIANIFASLHRSSKLTRISLTCLIYYYIIIRLEIFVILSWYYIFSVSHLYFPFQTFNILSSLQCSSKLTRMSLTCLRATVGPSRICPPSY